MSRILLISGSNQNYAPLLRGLLASIEKDRDGAPSFDFALLDVGLDPAFAAELRNRSIKVVEPGWDYDIAQLKIAPQSFQRAQTARPHLPKYFPGYDVYMWLDADTWIQDWSGIELYVESAIKRGFAVTPECDRSYWPFVLQGGKQISIEQLRRRIFQTCFGDAFVDILAAFPMINSGVFAARSDAPQWQRWSFMLGEIIKARGELTFFAEQNALNAVIRNERLPTALLPASHNWLCEYAVPMFDGTYLVEPDPPYRRLSVVHLGGAPKNGQHRILAPDGGERMMSLRFGGEVGHDIKR